MSKLKDDFCMGIKQKSHNHNTEYFRGSMNALTNKNK